MEAIVCSLKDERGLRAAMKGVDTVYHLAGVEARGSRADLLGVDIQGTQAVAQAAAAAGVKRIFYLSHLGADRASAFPLLKAKAIAENYIRQCGVDYTVLRSAVIFGPNDGFTTAIAALLHALPSIFLLPGDGSSVMQPLWIEDLVTCLTWALDDPSTCNQTYEVGGTEYLTFRQVTETVMNVLGMRKYLVSFPPVYLRILAVLMEHTFAHFPLTVFWLDYLAANRTCSLDTIPRVFNLMPARFSQRLDYLQDQNWRKVLLRYLAVRQTH